MAHRDRPIVVTTAPRSPREEQRARERRYLLTMGVRVVCFVGAIILAAAGLRWEAGIAIAASLILPWVAVIAANSAARSVAGDPTLYRRDGHPLPPGTRAPSADEQVGEREDARGH